MTENSMFPFFFQRDAGWCEALEEADRTRSRAAARNSYEKSRRRRIPTVIRAGYKTDVCIR